MIERQLLESLTSQTVNPAVANMRNHSTNGQQQDRAGRRTHAPKFRIDRPSPMDLSVGLLKGPKQSFRGLEFRIELRKMMRDQFHTQSTRKLPGRMGPHAVGNDEQIPTALPLVRIARFDNRITVLIVRASHPDVGASYSEHDRRPIRWGLGNRILISRGFVCQVRFQTTSKLELEPARPGDLTGYSKYRPMDSNRTRPQQPNFIFRSTPEDPGNYNGPDGRAVRVLCGFTAD